MGNSDLPETSELHDESEGEVGLERQGLPLSEENQLLSQEKLEELNELLSDVQGLPAGVTIPPLKPEQVELVSTPVAELTKDQLFTPVPLVARLTAGLDSLKQFVLRQREIVSEVSASASSTSARPPEARVNKLSNSGYLTIGFTTRLNVSESASRQL